MSSTLASWMKFNAVGLIGFGVQLGLLTFLASVLHVNYLVATVIAVEGAVIHNFIWHERWTWAHRVPVAGGTAGRFLRFNAGNGLVSLAGNVFLMWLLVSRFHTNYVIANVTAIVICSIANFFIGERLVYRVTL